MQFCAATGSIGQGALRVTNLTPAAAAKAIPATINTVVLFAVRKINPGTVVARPAITAPAPIVMRRAGNAQHKSVAEEASRAMLGTAVSLRNIRNLDVI